ncbi:hypothetical protein ABH944_008411 [Caballeronia udeis]|uniref:Uncharacterized protein n=1 Tax=Caballeronia udeis TaxID=1232866 RepID=A0ABW8MX95_9BURK
MSPELDHQLCTRYPETFARRHDRDAPIAFGIETCDCWFDLLDALCTSLQWATRQGDPQVVADQVKEKFGGLRFYYDQAISVRQEGMISLAEGLSQRWCAGHCGRQKPTDANAPSAADRAAALARLAALGGTDPGATAGQRRRTSDGSEPDAG